LSLEKPHFVLDSFALVAFFRAEAGGSRVRELLESARTGDIRLSLTTVNLGEAFYLMVRTDGLERAHEMLGRVREYGIDILDVDEEMALSAARLKAASGIGYADCFVAALAQRLGAAVVTGDSDFRKLEDTVLPGRIEWLPGAR